MENKTDYTEEIRELLQLYYAPVADKESANKSTIYKALAELHEDITNVLPSKWVYQEDVYRALQDLGFKAFPVKLESGPTTYLYYLEPK